MHRKGLQVLQCSLIRPSLGQCSLIRPSLGRCSLIRTSSLVRCPLNVTDLCDVPWYVLIATLLATRPSLWRCSWIWQSLVRCFLKRPSLMWYSHGNITQVRYFLVLCWFPDILWIYKTFNTRTIFDWTCPLKKRLLKNEMIGFPHDDDVRLAPAPAHSAQALLSPHCRVIPKNIIVNCQFNFLKLTLWKRYYYYT